jgi:hypothetical protein
MPRLGNKKNFVVWLHRRYLSTPVLFGSSQHPQNYKSWNKSYNRIFGAKLLSIILSINISYVMYVSPFSLIISMEFLKQHLVRSSQKSHSFSKFVSNVGSLKSINIASHVLYLRIGLLPFPLIVKIELIISLCCLFGKIGNSVLVLKWVLTVKKICIQDGRKLRPLLFPLRMEIEFKWDGKERTGFFWFRKGPQNFCEHGDGSLSYMKCRKFLWLLASQERLHSLELIKKERKTKGW